MYEFFNNDDLVFNLTCESPFNFICHKCGTCCFHRQIELNQFELIQIAKYLQLSASQVQRLFLIADQNNLIRNKNDGACIFLNSSGCSIYPARPLVCRLFPLGLFFGEEEKWAVMPRHPDCCGLIIWDKTVENYLQEQGALPYLEFERRLRKVGKDERKFPL